MRYVGITGFVSRAEVDACLAVLPEGLTLMCGVLVSQKTMRGERNKWWRRYPRVQEIAGIFSPDPRCLNLIHLCSDEPPWGMFREMMVNLGGPHCHGFQFNGPWPEPATLASLDGAHVVFQVRPHKDTEIVPRLRAILDAIGDCHVHVLIDVSAGRGLPIDPDICDAWGMMVRGHFGTEIGLGFAGGLDAESLPRIAADARTWGASIDAEGRLRDGDEGGTLNLDKATAYLRAAGEVFTTERT